MPTLVNDVREEGEDFTDAVVSRYAAKEIRLENKMFQLSLRGSTMKGDLSCGRRHLFSDSDYIDPIILR